MSLSEELPRCFMRVILWSNARKEKEIVVNSMRRNFCIESGDHTRTVDKPFGNFYRQYNGVIPLDRDVTPNTRNPVGNVDALPFDLPIQFKAIPNGLEHSHREKNRHKSPTLKLQQVPYQYVILFQAQPLNFQKGDRCCISQGHEMIEQISQQSSFFRRSPRVLKSIYNYQKGIVSRFVPKTATRLRNELYASPKRCKIRPFGGWN